MQPLSLTLTSQARKNKGKDDSNTGQHILYSKSGLQRKEQIWGQLERFEGTVDWMGEGAYYAN